MIYEIFIIPLLTILVGYLMYKYPPKKINFFIGYRTYKSMKNKEIWEFSNKYCGKLLIIIGIIMLVITSLIFMINYLKLIEFTENILSMLILCEVMMLVISIFIVENKIKNYSTS